MLEIFVKLRVYKQTLCPNSQSGNEQNKCKQDTQIFFLRHTINTKSEKDVPGLPKSCNLVQLSAATTVLLIEDSEQV